MTPLDLLLTSLAFLAGALGLWLVVCFVIAGVVLFKPRGRSNGHREPERIQVKVDRQRVDGHLVNADLERDPREIGKLVARQLGRS